MQVGLRICTSDDVSLVEAALHERGVHGGIGAIHSLNIHGQLMVVKSPKPDLIREASGNLAAIWQLNYEIMHEIMIWSRLAVHAHIVSFRGFGTLSSGTPFLLMERAELGSLTDNPFLELLDVASVFLGVAQGLKHMHECHMAHADIKPDNILVFRDGLEHGFVGKICDLGMACVLQSDITIDRDIGIGTEGFLPPEFISTRTLGFSTDVFAFGVSLVLFLSWDLNRVRRVGLCFERNRHVNTEEARLVVRTRALKPLLDCVRHRRGQSKFQSNRTSCTDESLVQLRSLLELALDCMACRSQDRPTWSRIIAQLRAVKE